MGSLLETPEDRKLWEMLGWWVVSVFCRVAQEIHPASTQYVEVSVDILASLGASSRLPDCNFVSPALQCLRSSCLSRPRHS